MPDLFESVYERRERVYGALQSGIIDRRVVDLLVTNGVATNDEAPLWDYKVALPSKPASKSDSAKASYDAKMAEIVKDCVSFYNTHGGYLIIGIDDTHRTITGWSMAFDASDLNKKIHGATGVSIETIYRQVDIGDISSGKSLGVLFIPPRPVDTNPAQFKKDAPTALGRPAYAANSFYLRERDNCRPASTPEDFEFLYGPRLLTYVAGPTKYLENNLPSRDQDFTRLIGREEELSILWMWLSDAFSPIKVLSGLGGVGKTSIAYTFAERLLHRPPPGLDRLVWLGAKLETFSGELNRLVMLPRTDFTDIEGLFTQILLETGCPPNLLPDGSSREEFLVACKEHLSEHSYILIVDNVDTLPDEDQQTVFHLLTQLCSVTRTKCILTARRNLGAPRTVYHEVKGLSFDDFQKFVIEKSTLMAISAPEIGSSEMHLFHEASGGSPLFTLSVLRLVVLGDTLKDAVTNWRGSDGDAVRSAAFKREIGRLKGNEARVLLTLCYLGAASAIELASILNLSRYEVQQALGELQAFAMTGIDSSLPGGASFRISPSLALVTSLVEQRVPDYATIKAACRRAGNISKHKAPYIADAVVRTIALLDQGETAEAIELVQVALSNLPENPDLLCLLGRCHQARGETSEANDAYQRAYDLACRKRELFYGWVTLFESQEDWMGVIEKTYLGEKALNSCRFRLARNNARAQLGNERCRAGNYKGAVEYYEAALDDIKEGLSIYSLAGDRVDLWKQNEVLAISWIGAVRQHASQTGDDERRVFHAYVRAITTYRLTREAALSSALKALSDWINRVGSRKTLSPTARDKIETTMSNLDRLRRTVANRQGISHETKDIFESAADGCQDRLTLLLKMPSG